MNRISLDFEMSRKNHNDALLRAIAQESLNFLFKHTDASKIKSILLTGSVAHGEGTVIEHESYLVTSDFDFVIYLDPLHFMKNRTHLQNLSQEITTRLLKRGVNTHITFVPSIILRAGIRFINSSIYEYEFASGSKCLLGKSPSFDKTARPTKKDALELTFTVLSDLLFLNFKNVSKIEESYIYAKRALTLLNSLLIFHGLFAQTYQERIKIAKRYASTGAFPISHDEIKMLEIFTEYKLSGSFQHILDALACNKTEDLLMIQKEFLKKLTTKILGYELMNFVDKPGGSSLTYNDSSMTRTLRLLREYSKCSRERPLHRIMGVLLYFFWSISRDMKRKEIFVAYIFHKQSPKTLLNVLMTLLFMHGPRVSIERILGKVFPWITFNETNPIEKLFSLWQIAERSINLIGCCLRLVL